MAHCLRKVTTFIPPTTHPKQTSKPMNPKTSNSQDIEKSKIDDTISETMDTSLSPWTRLPFKLHYFRPPFSFRKTQETADKE